MRPRAPKVSLAAVLRPGSALLSRLRYAPKFLIIGLALVLPLVYVSWSYTGQQSTQQAFSAKERIGLRYLTPATDVLDQLISARNVAVAAAIDGRPATGTTPELAKAIAAVDAEARDGANLGVSDTWAKLKTSIATATATDGDPRGIYNAYSLTTAAQIRFIVDIGDKSNLILDPDLDSYYLMDLLINKLPQLSDDAGKVADLQHLLATRATAEAGQVDRDDYTLASAGVATASEAVDAGLGTVVNVTANAALRKEIAAPRDALSTTAKHLINEAGSVVIASAGREISAESYEQSVHDARAVASPGLDRLLAARIAGIVHKERVVQLAALLGGLLAAYLFLAFYWSVARSVGSVVAATRRLAQGDLTTGIVVEGRDELADIAKAVNTAVERMRAALMSIADHASSLDSASTEVSAVSRSLSSVADQTENHSKVVAESAEEVAQQVQVVVSEQLAESLKDFASTAVSANQVLSAANRAVDTVTDNSERVERLARSSRAIGEIVALINSIAEQTNLLALNATIEAAHAGDAGRSFGVVASEVKDLARETAEATKSISERVTAMQTEADLALVAATETKGAILEIQENQQSIAVSMEEQTVLAGGIGRSLEDAVERSTTVARDVANFAQAAGETSSGARDLSASAAHLASVAAQLTNVVAGFTV